jgi:predicted small lipoprotein YifL
MKRHAFLLLAILLLSACGNKGPLLMPEARPAGQPAEATPAEPAATESGTPAR